MAVPHWCSVLEWEVVLGFCLLGVSGKLLFWGVGKAVGRMVPQWKQLGMSGSCWLFSAAAGSTLEAPGAAGAWHLRSCSCCRGWALGTWVCWREGCRRNHFLWESGTGEAINTEGSWCRRNCIHSRSLALELPVFRELEREQFQYSFSWSPVNSLETTHDASESLYYY